MDVGVFGGTFNPVHLGHLRAAEEVREALGLGRVWFVPSRIPPHKTPHGILPPEVRLGWVERAVAGNPGFSVSSVELERDGPSYSVDTLGDLARQAGPGRRLWFLLGVDAFLEIHTWHRVDDLLSQVNLAVMRRPPHDDPVLAPGPLRDVLRPVPGGFRHRSGTEVRFVPVTRLDISASRVRAALAAGRSVRYLVPESVRPAIEAWRAEHPHWPVRSES